MCGLAEAVATILKSDFLVSAFSPISRQSRKGAKDKPPYSFEPSIPLLISVMQMQGQKGKVPNSARGVERAGQLALDRILDNDVIQLLSWEISSIL